MNRLDLLPILRTLVSIAGSLSPEHMLLASAIDGAIRAYVIGRDPHVVLLLTRDCAERAREFVDYLARAFFEDHGRPDPSIAIDKSREALRFQLAIEMLSTELGELAKQGGLTELSAVTKDDRQLTIADAKPNDSPDPKIAVANHTPSAPTTNGAAKKRPEYQVTKDAAGNVTGYAKQVTLAGGARTWVRAATPDALASEIAKKKEEAKRGASALDSASSGNTPTSTEPIANDNAGEPAAHAPNESDAELERIFAALRKFGSPDPEQTWATMGGEQRESVLAFVRNGGGA